MVADVFGYQLLQLGDLGRGPWTPVICPSRKTWMATAVRRCRCHPGGRPVFRWLQTASMQRSSWFMRWIFHRSTHQVLREVRRVLIAEGRVIIIGFNPYSLWGLWRLFGRWKGPSHGAAVFCLPRLSDWLTLMGFAVEWT